MFHRIAALALAALLTLTPTVPAQANTLGTPTGDVVLTVTGDIAAMNSRDAAMFDRDMLRSIGEVTIETSTIWTEGVQTFTGVPLIALVEALGIEGGTLTATAVNDYATTIPVSEAVEGGPIIAYARNGAPMSLRNKGPLWIVYPYDTRPEYQSEVTYSRSIWQLDRLTATN